MNCVERACPFPGVADGLCRHHWEIANPVGRYEQIDALRAQYLAKSKAKGAAASDYAPRTKGTPKKMSEDDKADHIALVNLIAEETVKFNLETTPDN